MENRAQKAFLLIATILPCFSITVCLSPFQKDHPNYNECKGPYSLQSITERRELINTTEIELDMTIAPLQIKVTAIRADSKAMFCKDAFTSIGSKSCDLSVKNHKMDLDDYELSRSSKCRVGRSCLNDDCSGRESEVCNEDRRDIEKEPHDFEFLHRNLNLVRYSCKKTWSCRVRTYTITPHTAEGRDGFHFKGLNLEDIPLKEFNHIGGWSYFIDQIRIEKVRRKCNCLGTKEILLCEYQSNPSEFVLIRDGRGRDRNVIIGGPSNDGWGDLSEMTTVEEIKHLLQKLLTVEMRSRYNEAILERRIEFLQSQILRMISGDLKCVFHESLGLSSYFLKEGVLLCPGNCSSSRLGKPLNMNSDPLMLTQMTSVDPVIDEATSAAIKSHFQRSHSKEADPARDASELKWWDLFDGLLHTISWIGSWCGIISAVFLITKVRI